MIVRVRRWFGIVAGLAMVALPHIAAACPVCFTARNETLVAYFWTAVLMSLLPFGLIGGIGFWFYRRLRAESALDVLPAGERIDAQPVPEPL